MSDNQPQYFDVKTLMGTPWTRSVNLMCHLLQGITYKHLYGDPVVRGSGGSHLFDELLANAKSIHDGLQYDADGKKHTVREELVSVFSDIVTLVDTYNRVPGARNLVLGELYYPAATPEPVLDALKLAIVLRFEAISDRDTKMRHFCAPFVDIQMGRAHFATQQNMDNFLRDLGAREMVEFFTKHPRAHSERVAVRDATAAGILRANVITGIEANVHDGNGKWCCNGTCANSGDPLTWCVSVTINNNTTCALGSDYDPNCATNP